MEYIYVRDGHTTRVIYDFQKFNSIKAIYEEDAQTGLLALYDGNEVLYDLPIESRQSGGGTNLLFALIEFCFVIRETEGIEIHKIRGDMVPTDRDINREIYRAIFDKLVKELNSDIKLKYYNANYEELPFDQASYSQKHKGNVRHLEFIFP